MDFAGLNIVAIVVAAVASFMFGGAWYNLLSGPWMKAAGLSKEQVDGSGKTALLMLSAFVAQLVMAWVLAGLIGHLGAGQVTVRNGIISGVFAWAGFVMTTLFVNHGFQMQRRMLTLIDGGHWLGVLMIQGAIIGAVGV